ncbi:TOMM precursor leader peptide-binding protein [Massilia sp. W12]|uniref:TOMM precursor leader peptide-binding protein n=1 Tax=Massilia sp. W12 TaxID=3126507 RepID=UPI0030CBE2C4
MFFTDPALIPAFKPELRLHALDAARVILQSERKRNSLSAPHLRALLQAIDGQRSVQALLAGLDAPADTALAMLEQLAQAGYLLALDAQQAAQLQAAPQQIAFWNLLGADGMQAASRQPQVALHILPRAQGQTLAPELLRAQLQQAGLTLQQEARFVIVLCSDYLDPDLLRAAHELQAAGRVALPCKPNGAQALIGPLLHPQFGSCPHCLQFWIGHNRPLEKVLQRAPGAPQDLMEAPCAVTPHSLQAAYAMLAAAAAQLLHTQQDRIPLKDHLLAFDFASFTQQRQRLVARPQCPACGDAGWMARQAQQAPRLQHVGGQLLRDGGYRQRDPGATWEQYKHLVNPVCGPLAYLHPMPRRHSGLRKVYVAGYLVSPQQMPADNSFDKICAGKGQSDEQARASALCEALERYSGVYQGDELRRRASLADLRAEGAQALHFNELQQFSARQYAMREQINAATQDRRRQVPQVFTEETEIDWTPAWSLLTRSQVWLPLTYCYAEAPPASGSAYGIHNPNGAAAGNGLEEAILQAFLELVERDATAIWWYNRLALPQIDLASFGDPYFLRLQQEYAALGWRLWALDLTHDLGISVCAALAYKESSGRYAIGFGCHLSAHLALQRALTEVNQLFDPEDEKLQPWDATLLGDPAFLQGQGVHQAAQLPSCGGKDLLQDLEFCLDACRKAGLDFLLLDKTRPDIGLSVVQVAAPGLRHFWPRFDAGRLYDVPLAMGWRERALREEELNPAPLFL